MIKTVYESNVVWPSAEWPVPIDQPPDRIELTPGNVYVIDGMVTDELPCLALVKVAMAEVGREPVMQFDDLVILDRAEVMYMGVKDDCTACGTTLPFHQFEAVLEDIGSEIEYDIPPIYSAVRGMFRVTHPDDYPVDARKIRQTQ